MKKFLLKLITYVGILSLTFLAFYARFELDFNDRFYPKFLEKSNGLILGSSRALLGLDPKSIGETCPQAAGLLNFAFTQRTSPYGEVYYHAICSKLDAQGTNGLFLVEVSPLAVSSVDDALPEEKMVLGEMHFFNLNPNAEYVIRNAQHPFYMDVFGKQVKENQVSHSNGWLENLGTADSVHLKNKIATQIEEYKEVFATHRFSDYRYDWLCKTIVALKQHGTVVLVRMPVSETMHKMEAAFNPGFDSLMNKTAATYQVTYLNLGEETGYSFADLHHMESESAKEFSREVGTALQEIIATGL